MIARNYCHDGDAGVEVGEDIRNQDQDFTPVLPTLTLCALLQECCACAILAHVLEESEKNEQARERKSCSFEERQQHLLGEN